MDPNNTITIRTYTREVAAQLALIELEADGIEAAISADDCGGSRPELQVASGVRLLIDAADRDAAEEVLGLFEQKQQKSDSPDSPMATQSGRRPSRFLWFFAGALLASAAWGCCVYYAKHRTRVLKLDLNNDGQYDSWWTYEEGGPLRGKQDRNFDGRPDLFFRYENGLLVKTELDQNFDGKLDLWQRWTGNVVASSERDTNYDGRIDARFVYRHGVESSSEHDLDHNGEFDASVTYRAGNVETVEVRPNGSPVVTRREEYSNCVLQTEWVDTDTNGVFDLKRTFDPMGSEVDETRLDENTRGDTDIK